jgi:alpha/beta superfamily hydrolase
LDDWFVKLSLPKTLEVFEGADHFFVGQTAELVRRILSVFR